MNRIICLQQNFNMSNILNSKGIAHWLDVCSGKGHDWHWWREMFPQYLEKIED